MFKLSKIGGIIRNYSSTTENGFVYFGCFGNPMPFGCKCDNGTGENYKNYLKLAETYNENNEKYTKTSYKDGFINNYIKTNTGAVQIESDLYTYLPKRQTETAILREGSV